MITEGELRLIRKLYDSPKSATDSEWEDSNREDRRCQIGLADFVFRGWTLLDLAVYLAADLLDRMDRELGLGAARKQQANAGRHPPPTAASANHH